MDLGNNPKKRQRNEDQEMQSVSNTNEDDWEDVAQDKKPRKVIKAKRQATGSEIPSDLPQDLSFEDSQEDEFEEENVIQRDSDDEGEWEDDSDDENGTKKKKEIWNDKKTPIQEDEELVYDSSAYEMLHRSKVEWPCLSIDFLLRERCAMGGVHDQKVWFPAYANGVLNPAESVMDPKTNALKHKQDKHPMTVYMVAGSQCEKVKKNENRLYVMKWSNMIKTDKQDQEDSDMDSDEADELFKEPTMRVETVPHRGAVNRIRSMHGSPIVATWNEDAEVGIYNVAQAMEELEKPTGNKKPCGGCKLAGFKHKFEGWALDWSPLTYGRLASGSNDAQLWLYQAADESGSSFVKETAVGLQGHKGSIEDLQWSPTQANVIASCSSDQTIKLWDLRATQQRAIRSWVAHDCDVNVISWNTEIKFLLASGDDKGEFRIWDLRMLTDSTQKEAESITRIRWHTKAITSLQFEPRQDSTLAVASADNKLTMWDFSVEVDESETVTDQDIEVPPQLMFLHQGQIDMKEIRFHPQYNTLITSTAGDSINVFRPNFEPDDEEEAEPQGNQAMIEEQKHESSTNDSQNKQSAEQDVKMNQDVWVDSESDEEQEERRMVRAAKQINKNRRSNSQKKIGNKRQRQD